MKNLHAEKGRKCLRFSSCFLLFISNFVFIRCDVVHVFSVSFHAKRNFLMKRLSCNSIFFTWKLFIWNCLVCFHLQVDFPLVVRMIFSNLIFSLLASTFKVKIEKKNVHFINIFFYLRTVQNCMKCVKKKVLIKTWKKRKKRVWFLKQKFNLKVTSSNTRFFLVICLILDGCFQLHLFFIFYESKTFEFYSSLSYLKR